MASSLKATLLSFCTRFRIVGEDLAPTPEGRLLLVRAAVEFHDWDFLQVLSRDTSPMVRRAAYRAADEMDGIHPKSSHHKAIVESMRWERARRRGAVKIPTELMLPGLPPLQF